MQEARPIRNHQVGGREVMEKIMSGLSREFAALDARMAEIISSQDPLVQQVFDPVRRSMGKRIRPLLVFLSGQCFSPALEPALTVAVCAELVHTATLVHDDVVDRSPLRRGQPTLHALWGNKVAVLAGDFIFARAFHLLVGLQDFRYLRRVLQMISGMGEGEIMQLTHAFDVEVTEKQYLARIERKTALFFSTCCELGALAGGAGQEQMEALSSYGLQMGIAFQIVDDLFDYVADPDAIGKPVAEDLREGNLTLPVLHALRSAKPHRRESLRRWIQEQDLSAEHLQTIISWVREEGSLDYSRQLAGRYVDAALAQLEKLPPSQAREHLAQVARYVLERGR